MAWPTHDPVLIAKFAEQVSRQHEWKLEKCEPWREGASNAIWSLDTDKNRFVLKISKLEYWRRLGIESSVLECVSGGDTPLLLDHGEASPDFPWDWAILERVDGTHIYSLEKEDAFELGETLSRIREKTKDLTVSGGNWRLFVEEKILHSIEKASNGAGDQVIQKFRLLLEKLERCEAVGNRLDSLPCGIVHGDLIPLNLIKKTDGSFCLIDWEQPRRGGLAWDLAGIRKVFILGEGAFAALRDGTGETIDERVLDFADALQQLHVAAWRAEVWFGRDQRHYGDIFLVELGQELRRAEMLLNSLI